jgi:hypothetical protein
MFPSLVRDLIKSSTFTFLKSTSANFSKKETIFDDIEAFNSDNALILSIADALIEASLLIFSTKSSTEPLKSDKSATS